jgi:hypothetical protein
MDFSIRKYAAFGLCVGSFALLSCGRSATSSEKTTFTHIDSLTETYLSLQDTLLHSWNVLAKDEKEKLEALENALHHLMKSSLPNDTQLASLEGRLGQLKQIHITQKTLANPYVVEEYDFASSSLISELLSLAESSSNMVQDKHLLNLLDKIKLSDKRISIYRNGYDSIALQFNAFLEKNNLHLKEIDADKSLEKRSVFSVATNR